MMRKTLVSAVAVTAAMIFSPTARADDHAGAGVSPQDAVKRLKDGNQRFIKGELKHPNLGPERRAETVKAGQKPFVTVLGCSDSRGPIEYIFDQGIGDVFVIRVAGNVADTDEIGTIEYGVGHLKTPLLLVLGHTKCGAVTAVVEGAEVHGCIPELVDNIKPAADAARKLSPDKTGADLVAEAIRANVWQAISDVYRRSDEVRGLVKAGKLEVHGAIYDLESGKVDWLGPHPDQQKLVGTTTTETHTPSADTGAPPAANETTQAPTDSKSTPEKKATTPDVQHASYATPASTTEQSGDDKTTTQRPGPDATPDQVLAYLRAGNERFVGGASTLPRIEDARRAETAAKGQKPLVTVVSCSDSRVPVEVLFNQGIGDVFVIRVAGNVADTDEIGSIEYGVDHLETPVLLVLGHTKCGAVTAVTTGADVHGNIPPLVDNIKPAVDAARVRHPDLAPEALVPHVIETNVWQAIDDVFKFSPQIRERVSSGKTRVVGAIYDIEAGTVRWLGEHPNQSKLLGYTTGPKPGGKAASPAGAAKKGH